MWKTLLSQSLAQWQVPYDDYQHLREKFDLDPDLDDTPTSARYKVRINTSQLSAFKLAAMAMDTQQTHVACADL